MIKHKVFISSVQSEFVNERKSIADYIRQDALLSIYFEPFLFEELPAQDKSAQEAYLGQASHSEIYLLLMGELYGYEDEFGKSPTEHEYDAATANHAYRIAFIKETPLREDKENAFKHKIDKSVVRNTFNSYEELQSGVYASLVEYMLSRQLLRQGPFDASINLEAQLDDLNNDKIRWFVGVARESRQFPLAYSEDNIPQILQSLHLMTEDGKLKSAALLLFAKDVQKWFTTATVKCGHFYGTKVEKPMASLQIYGGTVFDQVDMAVTFVMSRIDQRVGERIHSARVDVTPELPAQAVREAIVNAVVHRDYTNTGSVQVMLFKDRLEVWNPGRLPHGMTIEKLSGIHSSQPVNPVLANPVYLAGYIEQMGTGTTDIIEQCEKQGLRTPEFYQDEDFRTILWRPDNSEGHDAIRFSVTGNSSRITEKSSQKSVEKSVEKGVEKSVEKILNAIKENSSVTVRELTDIVGLTRRGVEKQVALLKAKGILHRVGPDKGGHWEIDERE